MGALPPWCPCLLTTRVNRRTDHPSSNRGALMPTTRTRLTPLDVRPSSHDDRSGLSDGTPAQPFGFVYFDGYPNYLGQDVRMGYIGGPYDPDSETSDAPLHPTVRYQPYVFTGNWGEPPYSHVIAAWDYCVDRDVSGFASYAQANPDVIRWMNGSEFVAADRFTLLLVAQRERQAALRARRRTSLRPASRA